MLKASRVITDGRCSRRPTALMLRQATSNMLQKGFPKKTMGEATKNSINALTVSQQWFFQSNLHESLSSMPPSSWLNHLASLGNSVNGRNGKKYGALELSQSASSVVVDSIVQEETDSVNPIETSCTTVVDDGTVEKVENIQRDTARDTTLPNTVEIAEDTEVLKDDQNRAALIQETTRNLAMSIYRKRLDEALIIFYQARRTKLIEHVNPDIIQTLFVLACGGASTGLECRPLDAFTILKQYQNATMAENDLNAYASMYERMCHAIEALDPRYHSYQNSSRCVRMLIRDLSRMGPKEQRVCFPRLVRSLVAQRAKLVGPLAYPCFMHMVKNNFELSGGYLEHLLAHTTYFRQNDLPYAQILSQAVQLGRKPHPSTVQACLENLYPFTKVKDVYVTLRAIQELQKDPGTKWADPNGSFLVDFATLELIGGQAAEVGYLELSMLVWDIAESSGKKPTASIYENTILAFAKQVHMYPQMFQVLSEMQKNYTITRSFIRSVGRRIRHSPDILDGAILELAKFHGNGGQVSTATVNMLASACAERGDMARTLSVINHEYSRYGVEINADTFGFGFESMGKLVVKGKRRKFYDEALKTNIMDNADRLLFMLGDKNLALTDHIVREYVELLCAIGEVETATDVILDCLSGGDPVNQKTLYRAATANLQVHRFDAARLLADKSVQPMPYLLESIEKKEARFFERQLEADAAAGIEMSD